jgi:hypothetical protein
MPGMVRGMLARWQGTGTRLDVALRILSCSALAVAGVAAFLLQPSIYFSAQFRVWSELVPQTAQFACFACGVAGVVATAQRRQWLWCGVIVCATLLLMYGPFLQVLISGPIYLQDAPMSFTQLLLTDFVLLPALVPLVVLVYSRPRHASHRDIGIEISPLSPPPSEAPPHSNRLL